MTQIKGPTCQGLRDTKKHLYHSLAGGSVRGTQPGQAIRERPPAPHILQSSTQKATLEAFWLTTEELRSLPLLHIRRLEPLCQEGFHCVDNRIISPLIKPDHSAPWPQSL